MEACYCINQNYLFEIFSFDDEKQKNKRTKKTKSVRDTGRRVVLTSSSSLPSLPQSMRMATTSTSPWLKAHRDG